MKCLTSKCTSVQLETLDAFSLNTALIFHILCFVQTRTYHPIHPGRFSYQKPTFSVNSWHINQISAQAGDDGRCLSNPSTTYCHLLPASGWDWSSEVIMGHQNDSMQEKEYDVWDGSVLQHCETPWWQQSADSYISPFSPFFYYFSSADQESPLHLHYEFKPGAHDECAHFFAHIYMLHSAAKQNKRKKKKNYAPCTSSAFQSNAAPWTSVFLSVLVCTCVSASESYRRRYRALLGSQCRWVIE